MLASVNDKEKKTKEKHKQRSKGDIVCRKTRHQPALKKTNEKEPYERFWWSRESPGKKAGSVVPSP